MCLRKKKTMKKVLERWFLFRIQKRVGSHPVRMILSHKKICQMNLLTFLKNHR